MESRIKTKIMTWWYKNEGIEQHKLKRVKSKQKQKMIDPGIEPGTFSEQIQLCERDVITNYTSRPS